MSTYAYGRLGLSCALVCAIVVPAACAGHVEGGADEPPPSSVSGPPSAPRIQDTALNPPSAPGRAQPAGVPTAGTAACRPPPERVWQLSPLQLANTVAALLPTADARRLRAAFVRYATVGTPFTSDPSILNGSPLFALEVVAQTRAAVDALVAKPALLHPCLAEGPSDACVAQIVDTFGGRAFRRPVTADERAALVASYQEQARSFGAPDALKLLLRRVLASPQVLFRREVGALDAATGVRRLSSHELADLVAFTVTDGPPDAELRAAADRGALADGAVLEQQVRRLLDAAPSRDDVVESDLSDHRSIHGLLRFFREWLDIEATRLATRPKLGANEERVLRWLDNEAMMFIRHVLWVGDDRLQTLLGADFTFYSGTLATHYRLPIAPPENAPAPTVQGRRGLLMQSSFLTGHDTTTLRGHFVRGRLLCQTIKAPASVDTNLGGLKVEIESKEKRKLSPREVRARHMTDPQCSACHSLLDPLGFPFDAFDGIGLPRDSWDGFPIDTRGQISGTSRTDGPLEGAQQTALALAASQDVRDCFVEQLYAFVHGRTPGPEDACYLQRLREAFADSRGNVRDLLVGMLTGAEMHTRMPHWEVK